MRLNLLILFLIMSSSQGYATYINSAESLRRVVDSGMPWEQVVSNKGTAGSCLIYVEKGDGNRPMIWITTDDGTRLSAQGELKMLGPRTVTINLDQYNNDSIFPFSKTPQFISKAEVSFDRTGQASRIEINAVLTLPMRCADFGIR